MTNEEHIEVLKQYREKPTLINEISSVEEAAWLDESLGAAIKALEQEPRKGEWLRMSKLPEDEDDRYKCSCCGNVVHHSNKQDLYTFNSWCGRCGSDNNLRIRETEIEPQESEG